MTQYWMTVKVILLGDVEWNSWNNMVLIIHPVSNEFSKAFWLFMKFSSWFYYVLTFPDNFIKNKILNEEILGK